MKSGKAYKLTLGEVALFPNSYCAESTGRLTCEDKFLALEPSDDIDKILFNGIIYYAYIYNFWVEEVQCE